MQVLAAERISGVTPCPELPLLTLPSLAINFGKGLTTSDVLEYVSPRFPQPAPLYAHT